MTVTLTEHEQEDHRILRIIRANPGLDAVSLQAHGLVPQDAGRLGDLKARGRVDFKSGGWYLTSQGDLFLLQRWSGPVLTPDQKRHVAMLGGDPSKIGLDMPSAVKRRESVLAALRHEISEAKKEADGLGDPNYLAERSGWLGGLERALGIVEHSDPIKPQALRPSIETERPVGFVKRLGAGEIDWRQAGHPGNDEALLKDGWHPVFWGPDDV